jgi:PAS domain S-box-containing protein
MECSSVVEVVSSHPLVLAGSHTEPHPFFEQAAGWCSRQESVVELLSSNRDLTALSMLATTWHDRDLPSIVDDVARVLASIVNSEFIATTSLGDGREGYRLAWMRSAVWSHGNVIDALRALMPGHLADSSVSVMEEIANPADQRTCRVLFVPMGIGANALFVIGSADPGFPTASQRILVGLSVSLLSISIQRLRAETEEHRFAILVGNSKDFIGIASADGTPQYVNPAGRQLVGLDDVEQCRQLNILDFIPERDRIRVRDECWRIVTETGRWSGELGLRNFKTGAIIPVLVDWFRIDDKRTGEAAVTATVSRDLTAQKQAEAELRSLNKRLERQIISGTDALSDANVDLQRAGELQRRADARLQELQSELFHAGRLSAMGQMAGALAHEVGQSLGAIANYINAARRFLTEGRDHELDLPRMNMDHATEVVLRAGRIIQRLREFVAGGQPERHPENITDLIEDAGFLALVGAAELDIDVARHIAPNLPLALVDRIQIQQVLVNLIQNAIEAMADSERRELILTAARSDGDRIRITVADSGAGISDDVAFRLFQPFVTTKRQNMGLGLSICRSIVEAHGGQLWHEPSASGGTVFRFTVPTVDRDDDVQ